MNHVVVDASAMFYLLVSDSLSKPLSKRLATSSASSVELIDLEVINAFRKSERLGSLSSGQAATLATKMRESPIARISHRSLLERIWELRHSITPYDAAYVALAEKLDVPLITCDAKLAGSNSHKAVIEVYPTS